MVRRLLIALPATLVLLPVVAWGATTCSVQSPAASPTGTPSGQFTTQNGQIIGPNGQPFQARGVDVLWGNQPDAATLTQDFPGVNFVRLAVYNYASPSDLSAYVNSLTSQGIVVELEDHTNSTGANAGGGQGSAFTGQQLTNELNWYSSIGSAFASNPNVWFGTNNEPPGQGLSTWEQQTYNAIRSSGNNNPIMMEFPGGGESGFNVSSYGMDPSVYANMSNIIGDVHFYGWQANNSTDQGTVNAALNSLVQGAQTMQSASGPVPVIVGEYGTATDGQNADPNEAQVLQAVQSSGVGNVAWATMTGTSGQDALLAPGGGLTSYGQEVASYLASAASSCPVPAVTTALPTTPPAVASSTPTDPTPAITVPPATTTAPATSNGMQDAYVAAPATGPTTALTAGPLPTTAVASDPVLSAALTGTTAQVVPTYGPCGSVTQSVAGTSVFSAVMTGVAAQVIPKYGAGYVSGNVNNASTATPNTFTNPNNPTSTDPSTGVGTTTPTGAADTPQLQTMMAQSYGQTAASTADALGVNAASVAAIAQVESNFQNVGTANGSSSATGPWQFTQGTFNQVSQNNNLGFSSSDLTNPTAQATEAPYYLQQIASTIGTATGQPATTLQAYSGWVFGPSAGAQIANASASTPLSSIVSAQSLANNGMSGWSVGDFNTAMSTKLGAAANQTVLTTKGI